MSHPYGVIPPHFAAAVDRLRELRAEKTEWTLANTLTAVRKLGAATAPEIADRAGYNAAYTLVILHRLLKAGLVKRTLGVRTKPVYLYEATP